MDQNYSSEGSVEKIKMKPRKIGKIEKKINEILPEISEKIVNRSINETLRVIDNDKQRDEILDQNKRKSTLINPYKLYKSQLKKKQTKEVEIKPNSTDLTIISSSFTKNTKAPELVYFLPIKYDLINDSRDVQPCEIPLKGNYELLQDNQIKFSGDEFEIIYNFELKALVSVKKVSSID